VIVEAGHKSGALITGYLALEQNREVFAVPGPVQSMQSKGPHRLIKQGAKLVEDVEDILQEFPKWKTKLKSEPSPTPPLEALTETERRVWERLSDTPAHIDALAEACDLSTAESLSTLLGLEIKGFVRQLSGMKFVRV
jgi:DNA processing protein